MLVFIPPMSQYFVEPSLAEITAKNLLRNLSTCFAHPKSEMFAQPNILHAYAYKL